jgi:transcriptional regulator with XRE-family HTH domain
VSGFIAFTDGELERELVIRGLTQGAFAERAGIDPMTVSRAVRGQRLKPKSLGKIIVALGAIPVLNGPVDLIEKSA